jgi:hypothetical protein
MFIIVLNKIMDHYPCSRTQPVFRSSRVKRTQERKGWAITSSHLDTATPRQRSSRLAPKLGAQCLKLYRAEKQLFRDLPPPIRNAQPSVWSRSNLVFRLDACALEASAKRFENWFWIGTAVQFTVIGRRREASNGNFQPG